MGIFKYSKPKQAPNKLQTYIQKIIKHYQLKPHLLVKDVNPNHYLISPSIVPTKSKGKFRLVIAQHKLKDLQLSFVKTKIHRNILIPSLAARIFRDLDKKYISSSWYFTINQDGQVDIIEAFNSFGFLAKHYLLEEKEKPIVLGGEILVFKNGSTKNIRFNHLSGNYSKIHIDEAENDPLTSTRSAEYRMTKLLKKIFEAHLEYYKKIFWKTRENWVQTINLEFFSNRVFVLNELPPEKKIWNQHFPKRIILTPEFKFKDLIKAYKKIRETKTSSKGMTIKKASEITLLDGLEYY